MNDNPHPPANSIMTLKPYWHNGTWVFDDERVDLYKEPFVAGIPEIINHMTENIPDAKNGFRLLFSNEQFPGYQLKLTKTKEDGGGNWYFCETIKKEGWLCSALYKYYSQAPESIYVKAEEIKE